MKVDSESEPSTITMRVKWVKNEDSEREGNEIGLKERK